MCLEDKNLIKEKEKQEIMKAVGIIKRFVPTIKAIKVMTKNNSENIDDEIKERKEEIKRITHNYLERFREIKESIENTKIDIGTKIKNVNDSIRGLYFTVISLNLVTVCFFILNAIFKWIMFK